MAESRGHASGIPRRTNNMKLLTLTLAAAMVMAATGCETTQQKIAKGYVQDPAGNWVRGDRPYFGDGKPWAKPGQVAYDGSVFTKAMEQNYGNSGPQPVIVVGPNSPMATIATTSGGVTAVSTIGNRAPIGAPIYSPPAYGYYGY
jgi:hypothetical protein